MPILGKRGPKIKKVQIGKSLESPKLLRKNTTSLKYANRDEGEGPEIRPPFLRACPVNKYPKNRHFTG